MLADENHAERLLALTGLTPDGLRAGLADPAIQTATLDFLMQHEPDLLACAEALAIPPQALVDAHRALAGPQWDA